MGSTAMENGERVQLNENFVFGGRSTHWLHKFKLYETRSNFFMFGRDKCKKHWKVLKISRLEQSELCLTEDSTTYSENESYDLMRRIDEGNRSTGGLKFVTTCYGIVGFIKFLGPYYMLLVTKRRRIGIICGHAVYCIARSDMIKITNFAMSSNVNYAKNENRYKKLLRSVDLTKNFFFSYSYHVMHSLQKNLSYGESGLMVHDTMFVWNEFLTRGIHDQLRNSSWTVALVYGFFRQIRLPLRGHDVNLILIARRSRHYAGTRYLKRGVNDKGRVANDVETEQIVTENVQEGSPLQISSIVQNRGSIPLSWSQEISRKSIKPDIILSKKDGSYEATKLHFENLVNRYGNPIIILNLIKALEKKPRESVLLAEFANAIAVINKDISQENRLKFLHWDLNKYSRINATSALLYLEKVAENVLELTRFFYCEIPPCKNVSSDCVDEDKCVIPMDEHNLGARDTLDCVDVNRSHLLKPPVLQTGVLRTNCIDCLDRTNVAQYAYGQAALGHQLHKMGYLDAPTISIDSPLADDLMKIYEAMGDTLSLQYGGSPAHNKIFAEIRGHWKPATQSQEFLRTIQRYYSNVYMDAEKQDAINILLGHFQPQPGKPSLWELDSDQHLDLRRSCFEFAEECVRPSIKRSLSDGNIICDSNSPIDVLQINTSNKQLPATVETQILSFSESSRDGDILCSRYTPLVSHGHLHLENNNLHSTELKNYLHSNFLDFDRVSSSGASCEEETNERSVLGFPSSYTSSGEIKVDNFSSRRSSKGKEMVASDNVMAGFSESFVHWVTHGDTFSLS